MSTINEALGYSEDVLAIIEESEKLYKEKIIAWYKDFCGIDDNYNEIKLNKR